MVSDKLPSVLYRENGNSLSMERALKQMKELLEGIETLEPERIDRLEASIDDCATMLLCINRD